MKKILTISLMLALAGCGPVKRTISTESLSASASVSDKSHIEQLYQELRDSLVKVKAPVERSESRGLLESFLETSLAWSSASVDSTGTLRHTISNKDSIPSRVVFHTIRHTVRDTVFISRIDTVRIKVAEHTEKGPNVLQRAQISGFWILLSVVVVGLLIIIGKRYLKRLLP